MVRSIEHGGGVPAYPGLGTQVRVRRAVLYSSLAQQCTARRRPGMIPRRSEAVRPRLRSMLAAWPLNLWPCVGRGPSSRAGVAGFAIL